MKILVKLINSWAQGIILAVIIATIIEIIIPEGNNKKYIKIVIGIYILFSIIQPLINVISNKTINLNSIITKASNEMEKVNKNIVVIETNSYIEDTYINNLKENISQVIKEKGFEVEELNLYIEIKDEQRYGQINKIVMKIVKSSEEFESNIVSNIEKIEINISDSNLNKENEGKIKISEDEINDLKKYLNVTYSIEMEKIYINE